MPGPAMQQVHCCRARQQPHTLTLTRKTGKLVKLVAVWSPKVVKLVTFCAKSGLHGGHICPKRGPFGKHPKGALG